MFRSRKRSSRLPVLWPLLLLACAFNSTAAEFPAVDCVISPYQIVDLASPVSGVIERVLVERSDFVKKGQVVAELSAGVERAAVALAKARAEVGPEINVWQVNLNFDERRKARIHSLYDKKVISVDNKDEADREVELSGWKLQQALDLQTIRKLELDRAMEQLQQKIIRAPIDGFVLEKFRSAGEYIEDQAIVRIAQLDPLNVEAIVPIELFGKIPLGMAADIHPETLAAETRPARVTVVDRAGDAGSGTFGVRLEMPNPAFELPSGLKCDLRFVEGSAPALVHQPSTFTREAGPDPSVQADPLTRDPEPDYTRHATTNPERDYLADSTGVDSSNAVSHEEAHDQYANDHLAKEANALATRERDPDPTLLIASATASPGSSQADATRSGPDYHPIRLPSTAKQPAANTLVKSDNRLKSRPYTTDEATGPSGPTQTRRIGPIFTEHELTPVIESLSQQEEVTYQVSNSTSEQTKDYIVVSEVFPTLEALSAWISVMQQQGISDVARILEGDYKGRGSMGVFRNHAGAMRRKQQMSELGYQSEIFERTKTINVWWLDVQYSSNDADKLDELVRSLGRKITLVARDGQDH